MAEPLAANIFSKATSTARFASGGEIFVVGVRAELQKQPTRSNRDSLVPVHGGSALISRTNEEVTMSGLRLLLK